MCSSDLEYPLPLPELKVYYLRVIEFDLRLETKTNVAHEFPVKIVADNLGKAIEKAKTEVPWKGNIFSKYVTRIFAIDGKGHFESAGVNL